VELEEHAASDDERGQRAASVQPRHAGFHLGQLTKPGRGQAPGWW
jgi:hypothetical protein